MAEKNIRELILEALEEASILEGALEEPSEERMLYTAMRLSGVPHSFVKEIYSKNFQKGVDISL